MPLSEFQKKKLCHVFSVFYDVNRDGVIEWNDFEDLISRVAGINGWSQGDAKYKNGLEVLQNVWAGLQKYADKNKDKAVTKDEWLEMWNEQIDVVKKSNTLPDWQLNYLKFFFEASDTSGDNIVDLEEYTKVYTTFGLSTGDCKTAFNKITDNAKVTLDIEMYRTLWTDYILTDDQGNKANFLFGPVA